MTFYLAASSIVGVTFRHFSIAATSAYIFSHTFFRGLSF